MKLFKCYLIITTALLFIGCSQKSNSRISVGYHNLAARYNCYFLAKEKMLDVEDKISKSFKDDYNYILSYSAPYDTNFNKSLSADLEYVIEKGVIPLQKHKNSDWIAESYNIIGKSKWLGNKPDSAIYVYRYVLAKVDDNPGKQMAQILLLRTYLSQNDLRLAEEEFFQLKKQKIYEKNLYEYHISQLEYYYPQRMFEEMIPHLEGLLPLVKKKDKRARLNFIIGQIHQRLGNDDEAYAAYKKSLKRNPPYEIEFNAKLNLSQVSNTEKNSSIKKTNKLFRNMLADTKNDEYHGRIYYERAKYELKQNHLQRAIHYLNLSLIAPRTPLPEKTYAHLLLGKLYYSKVDSLPKVEKYVSSKLYYDSAVANMNPNFENAELILERQQILSNFVEQLEIVEEQEKLQTWASLSPDELKTKVDAEIAKDKDKQERDAAIKKKKELLAKEAKNSSFDDVNQPTLSNKSTFFAYNPISQQSQKLKFTQIWGDRKLEDNWRRSNRTSVLFEEQNPDSAIVDSLKSNPDSISVDKKKEEKIIKEIVIDTSSYTANIPNTPEKLTESNNQLLEAKYQLAKIYYYDLEERDNARDEFISYLEKFPDSKHEAEVLYFAYLIAQNDETLNPTNYVIKEKDKYPNSIYAKLMDDPNYLSSNEATNRKAHIDYETAFDLYKKEDFLASRANLTRIKANYPVNDILDKVEFLKILTYAKTDQLSKYYYEMQKFTEDFGTSPLVKNALKILSEKPANIIATNKIDERFYKNDSISHYFVAIFKIKEMPFNEIDRIYNEFRSNYFKDLLISTKQIPLSDSTYMVVNKSFSNLIEAKKYYDRLLEYHDFGKHLEKVDYSYYLVTSQNYNTLIATKNLDGYSEFYRREYRF